MTASTWSFLAIACLAPVLLLQALQSDSLAQPTAIVEDFSADVLGGDPTSFSTPAGFWSIASDSGKLVLLEDGRRWEGSTFATALADQARSLYGERWAEFIDDLSETGYFPISIFNRVEDFSSGMLNMRFKVVGGNIDQDCGLLFDYRPNGDYLALRSDTQENNLLLYRWVQGQPIPIKRVANVPTTFREWHEQTLVVSGRRVTAFLDGVQWLQVDLDTPVSGKVGLWSKTDTVVLFDRFTVEPGGVRPDLALNPDSVQSLTIPTTNLGEAVDFAQRGNLKGAHSEFVQFLGDWNAVKEPVRQRSPDVADTIEAAISQVKTVLLDPSTPVPDQMVYTPLLLSLQRVVQEQQARLSP
jgi:hypothetical protein